MSLLGFDSSFKLENVQREINNPKGRPRSYRLEHLTNSVTSEKRKPSVTTPGPN